MCIDRMTFILRMRTFDFRVEIVIKYSSYFENVHRRSVTDTSRSDHREINFRSIRCICIENIFISLRSFTRREISKFVDKS